MQQHGHRRGKGTRPRHPGRGQQGGRGTGWEVTQHNRGDHDTPPHRARHAPRGKGPERTRDQCTCPQGGQRRAHPPDPPGRTAHPDPGNTDPTSRTKPNCAPRPSASQITSARVHTAKRASLNSADATPRRNGGTMGPPHTTAHRNTAQHEATRHTAAQRTAVQRTATRHPTTQHSTAQHSAAWHSTAQPATPRQDTPRTDDFSSCFFPKFKKSAKRGFSREMTYFFGFYGPKIGGGAAPTRVLSKNFKNPEIWLIFGYFCLLWACPAEQCCTPMYLPIEDFRQKFQFSLDSLAPK